MLWILGSGIIHKMEKIRLEAKRRESPQSMLHWHPVSNQKTGVEPSFRSIPPSASQRRQARQAVDFAVGNQPSNTESVVDKPQIRRQSDHILRIGVIQVPHRQKKHPIEL